MAYITGSVTDANPGPALYALMAPALTTAGYTLVDTVTISTRTHKVWKSAAASNAQNLDWYLDVAYTTTGVGTLSLVTFEFYDPATDLGYRGPYNTSSATVDATTGSRYGATGSALETNWFGASVAGTQTSLPVTAFGYWMSATADRVILLSSAAPSLLMYAGLYDVDTSYAAKAAAKLYPLVSGQVGGAASTTTLGLTRIPPWTTTNSWDQTVSSPNPLTNVYPALPTGATTSFPFTAGRWPLLSTFSHVAGRWGWFKDVVNVPAAGVARGDTCTIGADTYILGTTAGGFSPAFKAA